MDENSLFLRIYVDEVAKRLLQEGVKNEDLQDRLEEIMLSEGGEAFQRFITKAAEKVYRTALKSMPETVGDEREELEAFVVRNRKRWNRGFDLLHALLIAAREAGMHWNESSSQGIKDDTLLRLHARCCRIGAEVIWLLEGGYPDGAMGRWRTLHETAVILAFLAIHDKDTAVRYRDYAQVESFKLMMSVKDKFNRLQLDPPTDEEIQEARKAVEDLIAKHGAGFAKEHGWCAKELAPDRPTFVAIEESIAMDHWRPYYKWSCQNVHAGSSDILGSLGLSEATEDILLAGASNSGFTDPAHCMATTLLLATSSLVSEEYVDEELLIYIKVIEHMVDEIGEAFLSIQSANDHDRASDNGGMEVNGE